MKLHHCGIAAVLIGVYIGIVWKLAAIDHTATRSANTTLTNSTQAILTNNSSPTLTQGKRHCSVKKANSQYRRDTAYGQVSIDGHIVYNGQQRTLELTKEKAQIAVQDHLRCAIGLIGHALEANMIPTDETLFVMYSFEYMGPNPPLNVNPIDWARNNSAANYTVTAEVRIKSPHSRHNASSPTSSVVIIGKPK